MMGCLIVETFLLMASIYLVAGMLFVIPFLTRGLKRVDEGAQGSSLGFRLIIIPGIITLWPFLLRKWLQASNRVRQITHESGIKGS